MTAQRVFSQHAAVVAQAAALLPPVLEAMAAALAACLAGGNKLLAAGNGGSAADAQHLVAELVGRFRDERPALAALALSADPATFSALANDYGYGRVFARQIEALASPGDLFVAISTSGNSANVVEAARSARAARCTVIALTGAGGGALAASADILCAAPSTVVARIQEVHGLCIHAWIELLEQRLAGRGGA